MKLHKPHSQHHGRLNYRRTHRNILIAADIDIVDQYTVGDEVEYSGIPLEMQDSALLGQIYHDDLRHDLSDGVPLSTDTTLVDPTQDQTSLISNNLS